MNEENKVSDYMQCILDNQNKPNNFGILNNQDHINSLVQEYRTEVKPMFQSYLPSFNRILGGFRQGELTIVTGGTSAGKTTFALNLAYWASLAKVPSLVMCFETPKKIVNEKLISIHSKSAITYVDPASSETVRLMSEDIFLTYGTELFSNPLNVHSLKQNSNGYMTISELTETIEYSIRQFGTKFFVVDHLHYLLMLSSSQNPVAMIDEAMRALKQLTLKHQIHIALVVHPAKVGEDKNGNPHKIGLNSSKGSSGIAQECDNFIVLEKQLDENQELLFQSQIAVLKNRVGARVGKTVVSVSSNFNNYADFIPTQPVEKKQKTKKPFNAADFFD